MSAEFSYQRETNPIDLVEQLAAAHNWTVDRTNDDELTLILNPEAVLFANPVAVAACAADCVAATAGGSC